MGLLSNIKYAVGDRQRSKQVAKAESGGSGKKGRGKHAAPIGGKQCGHTWTDTGPSYKPYPHKDHRCGDEPHNRGTHHCYGGPDWKCWATK